MGLDKQGSTTIDSRDKSQSVIGGDWQEGGYNRKIRQCQTKRVRCNKSTGIKIAMDHRTRVEVVQVPPMAQGPTTVIVQPPPPPPPPKENGCCCCPCCPCCCGCGDCCCCCTIM
ncbi:uncharacterized protein Dana_GF27676 [Drosophila ananassae]|uniref:Uncharacterized protein n=1 Tax=Drosophila ananassae TaxID=7217 RepID=A0A0P8YBW5_DROAN|nr:uncharacterized protein LOC26515085 [Drosophila ananassae]KPU76467.1 uncharacterized protein Dana_GF27676 [Drosophila ananassae]